MSISSKNIYYTSNSMQTKYPDNTRSSFVNQIDEQEFHYINKQNVRVGLKEITFENRYNTFITEYGTPSMIIVQDNYTLPPNPHYERIHPGPESPDIDIKSGFDYYVLSDCLPPYGLGKEDTPQSFTDVKISGFFPTMIEGSQYTIRFMVHNIYFHDSPLESNRELIDYLNYVFHNIEYDIPNAQSQKSRQELFKMDREKRTLFDVDEDGYTTFWDKRYLGLHIHLSSDVCSVLGLTNHILEEDHSENLQGLLATNFRMFNLQDSQVFTRDTNVQHILNMNWIGKQKYFRISQNSSVEDSVNNKAISTLKINLDKGKPILLGLRTNLTKPDIFKNCVYDTQLEFINVKDMSNGIQVFEVQHPTLYDTTIEKISNAKFEFIDIDTGRRPNFSLGTPTFIHFHVNDNKKMSSKFNLFLDSSDKLSQEYFTTNTPSDFCIKLPERLEFNSKWEVALKNIFIGNDLYNIFSASCWFYIKMEVEGTFDSSRPKKIHLSDGMYNTTKELCDYIQSLFDREGYKLKISFKNKSNRIKILCEEKKPRWGYMRYNVILSPMLANILGFDRSNKSEFVIPCHFRKSHVATYTPNVQLLIPRNFMILCDIVSESVFGSKSIKILKLLSSNFNGEREMINFDFHQEEFVDIAIKEFTSIRIQIVDTTGDLIKCGGRYPTRCQIQFMKSL